MGDRFRNDGDDGCGRQPHAYEHGDRNRHGGQGDILELREHDIVRKSLLGQHEQQAGRCGSPRHVRVERVRHGECVRQHDDRRNNSRIKHNTGHKVDIHDSDRHGSPDGGIHNGGDQSERGLVGRISRG